MNNEEGVYDEIVEMITKENYLFSGEFNKSQKQHMNRAHMFSCFSALRRAYNNQRPKEKKWVIELITCLIDSHQYVKEESYKRYIEQSVPVLERLSDIHDGSSSDDILLSCKMAAEPILKSLESALIAEGISLDSKPQPMNAFWVLYIGDKNNFKAIDYIYSSESFNIIDCYGVTPISIICNDLSGDLFNELISSENSYLKERIKSQFIESKKNPLESVLLNAIERNKGSISRLIGILDWCGISGEEKHKILSRKIDERHSVESLIISCAFSTKNSSEWWIIRESFISGIFSQNTKFPKQMLDECGHRETILFAMGLIEFAPKIEASEPVINYIHNSRELFSILKHPIMVDLYFEANAPKSKFKTNAGFENIEQFQKSIVDFRAFATLQFYEKLTKISKNIAEQMPSIEEISDDIINLISQGEISFSFSLAAAKLAIKEMGLVVGVFSTLSDYITLSKSVESLEISERKMLSSPMYTKFIRGIESYISSGHIEKIAKIHNKAYSYQFSKKNNIFACSKLLEVHIKDYGIRSSSELFANARKLLNDDPSLKSMNFIEFLNDSMQLDKNSPEFCELMSEVEKISREGFWDKKKCVAKAIGVSPPGKPIF